MVMLRGTFFKIPRTMLTVKRRSITSFVLTGAEQFSCRHTVARVQAGALIIVHPLEVVRPNRKRTARVVAVVVVVVVVAELKLVIIVIILVRDVITVRGLGTGLVERANIEEAVPARGTGAVLQLGESETWSS
jgi:hypothetical protein